MPDLQRDLIKTHQHINRLILLERSGENFSRDYDDEKQGRTYIL